MKKHSETVYTFLPKGYDSIIHELGENPLFGSKQECIDYLSTLNLGGLTYLILKTTVSTEMEFKKRNTSGISSKKKKPTVSPGRIIKVEI